MSSINDYNYEAYFLDHLEGNLNAEDTAALMLFLEKHPELKEELEGMEMITLDAPEELTFDKNSLHQTINAGNVDDYLIAQLENDINEDDAQELAAFVASSPEAKAKEDRYAKTILPAPEIVYSEKGKLKKRGAVVYYIGPMIGVAAAAIILLILNFGGNDIKEPVQQLSEAGPKNMVTQPASSDNPLTNLAETSEKTTNKEEINRQTSLITPQPSTERAAATQEEIVDVPQEEQTPPRDRIITPLPQKQDTPEMEKKDIPEIIALEESPPTKQVDPIEIPEEEEEELPILPDPQEEIAQIEEQPNAEGPLRLGEWVNKKIRQKVFKEENAGTEKIKNEEVFAAVVDKIDNRERSSASYVNDKNSKRTSYSISIGNFEFSRSKSR